MGCGSSKDGSNPKPIATIQAPKRKEYVPSYLPQPQAGGETLNDYFPPIREEATDKMVIEMIQEMQDDPNEQEEGYEDSHFEHGRACLLPPDLQDSDHFRDISFKRIGELLEEGYVLFDDIKPNDINQRSIGNCWFLASIASVAEWPERIERLFDNHEIPSNNCYQVNFWMMGEKVQITVDDYCMVYSDNDTAFAQGHSKQNEVWVTMAEKAFGKMHLWY